MESDDAILALAVCACGHGIGRHDEDGCPGAHATFCVCTMTPAVALDAAIERIRHASLRPCSVPRDGATPSTSAIPAATTAQADQVAPSDSRPHGPVRAIEPATMIALLAPRVIRPQ